MLLTCSQVAYLTSAAKQRKCLDLCRPGLSDIVLIKHLSLAEVDSGGGEGCQGGTGGMKCHQRPECGTLNQVGKNLCARGGAWQEADAYPHQPPPPSLNWIQVTRPCGFQDRHPKAGSPDPVPYRTLHITPWSTRTSISRSY